MDRKFLDRIHPAERVSAVELTLEPEAADNVGEAGLASLDKLLSDDADRMGSLGVMANGKRVGDVRFTSAEGGRRVAIATIADTPQGREVRRNLASQRATLGVKWEPAGRDTFAAAKLLDVTLSKREYQGGGDAARLCVEQAAAEPKSAEGKPRFWISDGVNDEAVCFHNYTTLAETLGVHRQTAAAMVRDGRLRHCGTGVDVGTYAFRVGDLRALRDERKQQFATQLSRFADGKDDLERLCRLAFQKHAEISEKL